MIREHLPDVRPGLTHSVVIGGKEVEINAGEFDDGRLGEIFIKIGKEGGELRVYDCFAIAISIALQYGVPLKSFVEKFRHQTMEPCGVTSNPKIPLCSSVVDYVFQWLERAYLSRDQLQQSINNSSECHNGAD